MFYLESKLEFLGAWSQTWWAWSTLSAHFYHTLDDYRPDTLDSYARENFYTLQFYEFVLITHRQRQFGLDEAKLEIESLLQNILEQHIRWVRRRAWNWRLLFASMNHSVLHFRSKSRPTFSTLEIVIWNSSYFTREKSCLSIVLGLKAFKFEK